MYHLVTILLSQNHRFKISPHFPCGVASSSRSYWWSSKTSTPVSTTTPVTEVDKESLQKVQAEASQPIQNNNEATSEDSTSAFSANESPFVNNTDVSTGLDIAAIPGPPTPLQLGDLKELGFCNWTPVGAVQAALEFIQVTTGLPWWGTIIVITGLTRLALVPFAVKQVRTTAAMAPVRPQMDALMAEVKEAKVQGDNARMQVAILKVRKLQRETGTGLGSVMTGPLLQASTSIVMFLAIKRLCDLPVPQIQYESVAWLPSLAAGDPYYLLPALSVALMNLQIYVNVSLFCVLNRATTNSRYSSEEWIWLLLELHPCTLQTYSLSYLSQLSGSSPIYLEYAAFSSYI
jgi:YidC/Oxa1 family membrane protein insertase